jgi:two-component system chemotaxis response regulator CheY
MPAEPIQVNEPRLPRVLIADDASGMRIYLSTILKSAGFDCVEAADGGEAFDALLKTKFDLLITDLEMPGMDGFQLLSAVSLLPTSRGRPAVIVCSALLDETLAERRPELRTAAALLAKPVQPQDLIKVVKKVLSIRATCA